MARRPLAATGPQEYRKEAAHLEGEENIDAGDYVFSPDSMLYRSAAPSHSSGFVQLQSQYFVPSESSPRTGSAAGLARVDLPQY